MQHVWFSDHDLEKKLDKPSSTHSDMALTHVWSSLVWSVCQKELVMSVTVTAHCNYNYETGGKPGSYHIARLHLHAWVKSLSFCEVQTWLNRRAILAFWISEKDLNRHAWMFACLMKILRVKMLIFCELTVFSKQTILLDKKSLYTR